MANSISLFKKYTDLLDEVYKQASLTGVLESDAGLATQGANANEIVIPKISMQGLGDYSRNSGYTGGDVTLTNETVQFNYDRGRAFNVDAMDNEETAGVAFGKLSSEFIRTKVVPEMDAFRFAKLYANYGKNAVGTLSSGADVLTALIAAQNEMDEQEVPYEQRILFITPTLFNSISALDTTKSREVLNSFAQIVKVPQSRFYTGIVLNDGVTEGQKNGGFAKASSVYVKTRDTAIVSGKTYYTVSSGNYSAVVSPDADDLGTYYELSGKDINFMVVHKPAVIQYTKHLVDKAISPEENQNADAWKFCYRAYALEDVYENKVAGIYVHNKA